MSNILIVIFSIYLLIKSEKIIYSIIIPKVPLSKTITKIKFQCLTIKKFNYFTIFKLMKKFLMLLSSRVLIGVLLMYAGKIKYYFMS